MRVTLIGFGSDGDLRPLLALAGGLTAAGHSAVVVGEESGSVSAFDAGVEFHPLVGGLDDLMGASPLAMARFRWPDREWIHAITAAASDSDLVVGFPAASYHAVAAAERVGATAVLGALQPMLPTQDFVPSGLGTPRIPARFNHAVGRLVDSAGWAMLGSRVNAVRHDLGLASMPNPYHSLTVLCGWSPHLVPMPSDWDGERVTVTGQWSVPSTGWTPDPELEAFMTGEERPLYVGFGSMRGPRAAYAIESILRAVGRAHRVVLQAHPSITATLPENVLRIGAVPHDWLFPRCGALFHHAGAGTAHAAARSGVPSVPVPFMLDQPFWADRLHRLGVASKPVDPRSGWDAYEKPLRETVAAREPARELAVRMGSDDGIHAAIKLLESLLP